MKTTFSLLALLVMFTLQSANGQGCGTIHTHGGWRIYLDVTGDVPNGTYEFQRTYSWFGQTGTSNYSVVMTGGVGTVDTGSHGGNGSAGTVTWTLQNRPGQTAYVVTGNVSMEYASGVAGQGQTWDCHQSMEINMPPPPPARGQLSG